MKPTHNKSFRQLFMKTSYQNYFSQQPYKKPYLKSFAMGTKKPYKTKAPFFWIVFVSLFLGLLSCQGQPKTQAYHPKSPPEILGDWYTTNRHLKFQEQGPGVVDAYNGPKGAWKESYHIDAVDYHSARIFFLTLTPVNEKSPSFQRMFVLSHDAKNMREFMGERIIQWSRNP